MALLLKYPPVILFGIQNCLRSQNFNTIDIYCFWISVSVFVLHFDFARGEASLPRLYTNRWQQAIEKYFDSNNFVDYINTSNTDSKLEEAFRMVLVDAFNHRFLTIKLLMAYWAL